jgi:hypothetical protein
MEQKEDLNNQFEKSFMIRNFIHIIGDIHQPLHAAELYSQQFQKGDEGGNLFKIEYSDNINNLHKLFDSGVDKLPELKRVKLLI